MSRASDQNVPSESWAIATTRCVPFRRMRELTSAFPAGTEAIGGVNCDHYALRHKDVDWQIWIRQGENALPCKLVITMTHDPAMPQFSAVYRWSDDPPPGPEAFAFKPPAGANPITFGMVKTAGKGN